MEFIKIELKNWKNFKTVGATLRSRVFIIGPNASGKSNFLDAFRFVRDIVVVGGGLQKAIRDRGGMNHIRSLAATSDPNIRIFFAVKDDDGEEWEYDLVIGQESRGDHSPIIKSETVRYEGNTILARPNLDDREDAEQLRQTHIEQVGKNKEYRVLAEFFRDINYLHIVPQLIRDPDRSAGIKSDPFGGDFLDRIAKTPSKIRDSRLKNITKALSVAVPQLQELVFELEKSTGKPHLKGRYSHWRRSGAWQNEHQFSDGTLRLIGLMWSVLDGQGALLLEEPELSLHSQIIKRLPSLIYSMQRMQKKSGRQIIISTHSPSLLEDMGIAADEVLITVPSSRGTDIISAYKHIEIKKLVDAGMSVYEAAAPYAEPKEVEQLSLL